MRKVCSYGACLNLSVTHGLCKMHAKRHKKNQPMNAPRSKYARKNEFLDPADKSAQDGQ